MADRNDQGQHSDEYRPFDDPKHPSWYTDPSAPEGHATPQQPGGAPAARNPYADQPLAGPYSDGQPQYPIHGGYPVVANQPGQQGPHRPGQNPYDVNHGQGRGYGQPAPYGQGGMQPGRMAGTPYPGGQARSAGLGITAMVLGIAGVATFGFLFVPQVLAIVFGHISRAREPEGKGFATAGLIMGYLVTGLWTLLLVGFIAFGAMLG
jgi:hypothetical protein